MSRNLNSFGSRMRVSASLAVILALQLSSHVAAQDLQKKVVPFEGSQAFRYLLHLFRQQPIKKIEAFNQLDPKTVTLIVFGDPSPLRKIQGLRQFHRNGGALLIATDRNDQGILRRAGLGVRINGQRVTRNAANSYRRNPDCPLITYGLRFPHPLFKGLEHKKLATNRPSRIQFLDDSDLRMLAVYSWPFIPYVAGTEKNAGPNDRKLVIAGHGVFMNGMMAQDDNDNFTFAYNAVRWLTNEGKRKHVLFIEEGQVQESFDIPLAETPDIPLDKLAEILAEKLAKLLREPWRIPPFIWNNQKTFDKALDHVEKEGLIDQLYDKYARHNVDRWVNNHDVLRLVVLGFTGLLVIRGLFIFIRSRYSRESNVPLSERLVDFRQSDRPTVAQRHRAMLMHGNLYETARLLARRWFAGHCDEYDVQQAPPPVAAASWWKRSRWQKRIKVMWEVAYGNPSPVSPVELQNMLNELHKLDKAIKTRRFTLGGGRKSAYQPDA